MLKWIFLLFVDMFLLSAVGVCLVVLVETAATAGSYSLSDIQERELYGTNLESNSGWFKQIG